MELGAINRVSATPAVPAAPWLEVDPKLHQIVNAVHALNRSEFAGRDRQLSLLSDPRTKGMVIRIVDRASGEVIDQIPEERVLRIAAEFMQQQRKGVNIAYNDSYLEGRVMSADPVETHSYSL